MRHPGNPETVMRTYRRHIVSCKAKWRTARGLIHYKGFVQEYLAAKRSYLELFPVLVV